MACDVIYIRAIFVVYTTSDIEWSGMMNTKRLMKRLATGLLGMSVSLGVFCPSQSHASTIANDKTIEKSKVLDIYKHIVDDYKPIDYSSMDRCSGNFRCDLVEGADDFNNYISNIIYGTNFDFDDYERFHDTLLLALNKYYEVYPKISDYSDNLENWSLDKNGIMVDQSDRHKKIFNYLLLKLYFMSSPKYFYKDLNMKEWDKTFISEYYRSTSVYINTHIDRDTNGHFDTDYIKDILDNSGDGKKQEDIEKGPIFPVLLHEPLALYNLHRASQSAPVFLGLDENRKKPNRIDSDDAGFGFRAIGDTDENAIHAIEHMLGYNNIDIETQQFTMESQNLFHRYPISIFRLLNKGVNPLNGKDISSWGDLKINNLVFPAFLNIGLGSDVKVSGNMLIVSPSHKTHQIIAPDNGPVMVRGLDNEIPVNIGKRYINKCSIMSPESIVYSSSVINNKELAMESNVFLMDNRYPCYSSF